MKKIKIISILTALIIISSSFANLIGAVNAATTQATVTYGEITDNGVEVTVKFSQDIISKEFSSNWQKVDNNTIKATYAQGTYAYVKIESSDGTIEEGKVAVPIKLEEKYNLDMTPKDTGITITNLQSSDSNIATVEDLKITAVKEGTTKITGDIKFSSDDEAKTYTWNLTVVAKSNTTDDDKKQDDTKKDDESNKQGDDTKKDDESNKQSDDATNTKVELTKEEIKEIEDFINDEKSLNTGFLFINYASPEELVKKVANENEGQYLGVSAIDTLRYAIINSRYGKQASEEQLIAIYGNLEVTNGQTSLMSEDDLIKFFKDKINYEYTNEKIKSDLKDCYNEKVNAYVFNASDVLYEKFEIKSGYRIGNKYYIEIEYPNSINENKTETIHLVMEKDNGVYKFYSCENSAINETVKTTKDEKDGKDETTADKKLPQTGINQTALIGIVIIAIALCATFFRYRKYKNIK